MMIPNHESILRIMRKNSILRVGVGRKLLGENDR